MPYFWPILHDILANPALSVKKESRTIHPSSMGITLDIDGQPKRFGGCRRAVYYRLMNYPNYAVPDDFEGEFKKNCGNFVSDMMVECFKRGWMYLGHEVPVSITRKTANGMRYRISGRIDIVVKDPSNNRPHFIEMKTGGDFKARGNCKPVRATKWTSEVPLMGDFGDICQSLVYLWWAREELGVVDPEINLMYFTRDRCHKGEHIIRFHTDDSVIVENAEGVTHFPEFTMEKVFEDTDSVADAVKHKQVPDRDYELQWSRERILNMHKHKRHTKTDATTIQRNLDKEAELLLERGDWRCNPKYCEWSRGCYGEDPQFVPGGQVRQETLTNVAAPSTEIKTTNPELA